jgi:predicted nucleotidyltransferase
MVSADPQVLHLLGTRLRSLYGERLEPVVLFGSRARGDATPESDYDVAVFLRDLSPRIWLELAPNADLTESILEETGSVVTILPVRARAWNERTPLMHEIRRDGVDL